MGHARSAVIRAAQDARQTKRIQHVLCMGCTTDYNFLVTRSNTTNPRLWKLWASKQVGQRSGLEETMLRYREALVQKYAHLPKVRMMTPVQ